MSSHAPDTSAPRPPRGTEDHRAVTAPTPLAAPHRSAATPGPTVLGPIEPVGALVEGTSFCASGPDGDISPDVAQGLFVRDTRVLSGWRLRVDGKPVQSLATVPAEPFEATFVGRVVGRTSDADSTLVVERHRLVGTGMRETISIRNHGTEPAGLHVTLEADADFADLFEVKEGIQQTRVRVEHRASAEELSFWTNGGSTRRGVRISATGGTATPHAFTFRAVVPPQGTWSTTVEVLASVADQELEPPFDPNASARRMRTWRQAAPRFEVDSVSLRRVLRRTEVDLGALRIVDHDHPEDDVVAAGAPWFMALFGRDSLLTAWMSAPFAPGLALGTLRTLARFQGTKVDALTEEQPGRILHEVRLGADLSLALGGDSVYYGSIDSTPLFVVLVDRVLRWGTDPDHVRELLPAVDAALDWIRDYGDRDGDGFVEYQRSTDRGLLNQGWKDSHDSLGFADGTLAEPPIALAEVQGYVYAAYLARAHIAEVLGDEQGAGPWRQAAARLRAAFDEAFWLPRRGCYALALDRDKRPVDAVASNQGHCLWSGIVPPARAAEVADALMSPSSFTGFGVRTLDTGMRRFNPVSYHNGSVWPHDSTLVTSGLFRYGLDGHARTLRDGLLAAASAFTGRLPELFCGFDRESTRWPVPYPTSCSPQAWAAASPYELVRASFGLEVCVPHGELYAHPPVGLGAVTVDGLPVGGGRARLTARDGRLETTVPAGLTVVDHVPACAQVQP